MKTALYWHRTEDGRVRCDLCPQGCTMEEGQTGICRARTVQGGELRAAAYGLVSSAGMDPIEKKPLYHFLPGSDIFSIGGWGCNFACTFCQNWTLSQSVPPAGTRVDPAHIIRQAEASRSVGIAYTYNEPLIGFEFVRDCARLAADAGLANVLVTNGFICPAPAAEILPTISALNIDIKSMDESFYRRYCRGRLQPVLDFAVQAVKQGCHVEITNLVIPGLNDDEDEVAALAEWIAVNLGTETPLHLSAYRPMYKMDIAATPAAVLERAYTIACRSLTYVYMGNVVTTVGSNTRCPGCGEILIRRAGYRTQVQGIKDRHCVRCGRPADVVLG